MSSAEGVPEVDALAQKIADKINPPHWQTRPKNLPVKERRKLPVEDLFEKVWVRKGPDDQPYITFKDPNDGYPSFRNVTFREIAEAVLAVLEDAA